MKEGHVLRRTSSSYVSRVARIVALLIGGVGCSQQSTADPAAVSNGVRTTDVNEVVVVTQASVEVAGVGSQPAASESVPAEADLLTDALALLGAADEKEQLRFLSSNVPETEVAACMAAAGFDYTPGPSVEEQSALDPRQSLSPAEFAKRFGFGVSSGRLGMFPAVLDEDPNADQLDKMSAAEQQAYFAAYTPCAGGTPERIRRSNALNIAVSKFKPVIESDQRVSEALTGWRDCIGAAGFAASSPLELIESYYAKVSDAGGDQAKLNVVLAEEVNAAEANRRCEPDYREIYREVIVERFSEFAAFFESGMTGTEQVEAQG